MTTNPVTTITDEQIAEIEAYAQNSKPRDPHTDAELCVVVGCNEVLALISRLRAAEMDAERYRWIRDRHNSCGEYFIVKSGEEVVIIEDIYGIEGLNLNAAVDAAMKGDQQ